MTCACCRLRLSIVIASMASLFAAPARAQQVAATFEELRSLIRPGETIYVTDVAGTTSKGRFGGFTGASSQLLVQRGASIPALSLSERDVNNIAVERADTLWNGMLIGFVSGAAPVALIGAGASASGGEVAGVAAGYGGIGLLTGLLIDVLNKEKVTIYVQRPAQRSTRIHVSPFGSKSRAGVQISVGL